jgi:hypothetical protein
MNEGTPFSFFKEIKGTLGGVVAVRFKGAVVDFPGAAHRPRPPSRAPRLNKAGRTQAFIHSFVFLSPPVFKVGRKPEHDR